MEMWVEIKIDANDDPFEDEPDGFEIETREKAIIRGQLAAYTAAQMSTQFRTAVILVADDRRVSKDPSVGSRWSHCD